MDLNDFHGFPMVSNDSIVFHTQILFDFSCYTLVLRIHSNLLHKTCFSRYQTSSAALW